MTSGSVCSGEDDIVEEGRKSFPSGHSGWALCCGGFLSLYLSGKLQVFRPPGQGQAWRLCVVVAPLLTACAAALTRIQDNKHHWQDVTVGGIIGLVVCFLCYLQYYPSPLSPQCDSPLALPHYSFARKPNRTRKYDAECV
jgi:membrane-associated phospholipid phosphatase